jgi:hypothetical protein
MNDAPDSELPAKVETPPLEVLDPVNLDEAARLAFKSMGMSELSATNVHNLRAIGAFGQHAGIMKTEQGRVIVNQQWLGETLARLGNIAAKVESDPAMRNGAKSERLAMLARVQGFLVGKMTEASALSLRMETETVGGRTADVPVPASNWKPGMIFKLKKEPGQPQVMIAARDVHVGGPMPTQNENAKAP